MLKHTCCTEMCDITEKKIAKRERLVRLHYFVKERA